MSGWSRRRLLAAGAQLAVLGPPLVWSLACGGGATCVDADQLSTGEASLRASLHFTERSPHGREKDCASCEFFRPAGGEGAGCGTCSIFQGPANPRGYCDSWSPRGAGAGSTG